MIAPSEIGAADRAEFMHEHQQRELRGVDAERAQRLIVGSGQDARDLPGTGHHAVLENFGARVTGRGTLSGSHVSREAMKVRQRTALSADVLAARPWRPKTAYRGPSRSPLPSPGSCAWDPPVRAAPCAAPAAAPPR
ncbi:hypothetical protein D3C72_1030300 [compost metagenome]